MLNRLISDLPFNPSLVEELSFYGKRLRRENSIRRLGFVLIILSLLVQIFAASVPAEKSIAASYQGNDVIPGGPVNNLQELRNKYNSMPDVKGLYQRFGLNIDDLQDGRANHINFGFQDQGSQGTRTVGRLNFSYTNDQFVGNFAGQNFWSRNAAEWQGSEAAFAFGVKRGTDNKTYMVWVLKNCGNIAYRPTEAQQAGIGQAQGFQTGLSNNQPVQQPKPTTQSPVKPPTTFSTAFVPVPNVPGKIEIRKSAVNITRDLSPKLTVETPAKPDDVIEYTLFTKTTGNKTVENYKIEDYVGDLLDYSELDMASIASQGGHFDSKTKKIIWDNQKIEPGSEVKKTFRIKVKHKIPKTNSPNKTAPDFDCRMQNGYGNEVVIAVDCPNIKKIETLPNTGPGDTLIIGFGLATLSGYFLARNNLIGREIFIIRRNYSASGDK